MIQYRDRIEESGDMTVARLIYEDWEDRYKRKNIEIENLSFQQVIRDLAEKYRDENKYIRLQDIDYVLAPFGEKAAIFEDFRTGGILKTENNGLYSVNENYLVYGLGLLLVDELEHDSEATEEQLSNVVADWLEPHSEMDIKASICSFAALHCLTLVDYPKNARVALLNAWINVRNPGESIEKDFIAYLPVDPKSYVSLSEIVWTDSSENQWAQQLLMQTFLHWKDNLRIQIEFQAAFERWLGFVNIYGSPTRRRDTPTFTENIGETQFHFSESIEVAQRIRQEIYERIGEEPEAGSSFQLGDYRFTAAEDDGLIRLGRVALAIISHLPRTDFLPAIVTGLLAEELMDFKTKGNLISWVIRTTKETLWPSIEDQVDKLLLLDQIHANKTAHRLLEFEGSNFAFDKQRSLPENTSSIDPLLEQEMADPCRSMFLRWSKSDCERCLLQESLDPRHLAKKLKWHAADPNLEVPENLWQRLAGLTLDPVINIDEIWLYLGPTSEDTKLEDYETALCAYASGWFISLIGRIFQQVDSREGMALRQLSLKLKQYSLILQTEEYIKIFYAWENLLDSSDLQEDIVRLSECFLFKEVLRIQNSKGQLELLLERPEECTDLIAFENIFLPIQDWDFIANLTSRHLTSRQTQRVVWFLASHPEFIPQDSLKDFLFAFTQHEDSLVRSSILKILYKLDDCDLTREVIENSWRQLSEISYIESLWASLLIGKYLSADFLMSRK